MKALLVLCLAAATVAAQELKPEKRQPARDLPPGQTYEGVSKSKRPYWYRLPNTIDAKNPPNLVLMMHGTGLDYRWSFWNYPIHKHKFRPKDIVVSPESEFPKNGFMQGKSDRDEIAGLIKTFRKTYPIGNVYLYGHSQGAFFVYYFAGEKPDLIDGVVAHAGNFFKAKFNKGAREKVGIGILHGRKDAVVTVDCAYRTDLLYRGQSYRNVKLFVVEGLNEQSGHWPLPWHLARMLEWLDLVSIRSARSAVDLALAEIGKDEPDPAVIAIATARGKTFVQDAPRDVQTRLDALAALVEEMTGAHANVLLADAALAEKKPAYGAWAAHLRRAQAAFSDQPRWQEAMRPHKKLLAQHDKAVAQAMKALAKSNKKSFAAGLKAMEGGYLGRDYETLLVHLSRWHEKPGKRVTEKALKRYEALLKERKPLDKKGLQALAGTTKPLLDKFRADHAEWLGK